MKIIEIGKHKTRPEILLDLARVFVDTYFNRGLRAAVRRTIGRHGDRGVREHELERFKVHVIYEFEKRGYIVRIEDDS